MKNFPIKDESGKEYWISRSVAAVSFIFCKMEDDEYYVLCNKRGEGTPDFQGYWNCPCGYVDFDERIIEAAAREVYEETGYIIDPAMLNNFGDVNDDPNENRQNITFRYYAVVTNPQHTRLRIKNDRGGESNEVSQIQWINCNDILNNKSNFKFAFNHRNIIKSIYLQKILRYVDQ